MKIHGSISNIKRAIEKRYWKLYEGMRDEAEKQISQLRKESSEKLSKLREWHKAKLSREKQQLYTMLLNEEKLKLRIKRNDLREKMVNKVLEQVRKKSSTIVLTQEYIDFVKSRLKEEKTLVCLGSSESYKKHFPNMRIDKTINGLRFEGENAILDFSVDSIIESKKDELRCLASKKIFGEE